jgi:sulfatase modifying factor 1
VSGPGLRTIPIVLVVALAPACRPPDRAAAVAAAPQAADDPPHGAPRMIAIAAGTFTMGRDDGKPDESPAHEVRISAFAIDETLVTFADFRDFVDATGWVTSAERLGFGMTAHEGMEDWAWARVPGASFRAPFAPEADVPPPNDDDPVVMVSWHDAAAFCEHRGARLPTEAEWEYAMRAGRSGTRFPWGDDPRREGGQIGLNYWQGRSHEADTREDGHLYVSPVRAFPPNAWGIHDPVGNVWQWVADWYAKDTYERDGGGVTELVTDPVGPAHGWAKVARGGSWWCSARACSAHGLWARGKSRPDAPYANNGFRCAAGDLAGPGSSLRALPGPRPEPH